MVEEEVVTSGYGYGGPVVEEEVVTSVVDLWLRKWS